MTDMCLWCGRREAAVKSIEIGKKEEVVSVCSDECETRLREFQQHVEAHVAHFFVGLFLPWVVFALLFYLMINIDQGALATAVGMCGMGIGIIMYPFATPQTIAMFGAQKSITIVRVTGVFVIAVGVFFYLLIRALG